jgi:hypothetical protein
MLVKRQSIGEEYRQVNRRAFLGLTGAAAARLGIASLGSAQSVNGPPQDGTVPGELRLAGMSLADLRQRLYNQLFQVLLPFWDHYGIDHEYGGLMCSLDYDGTLLDNGKNLWFLGRAIWVYSFLYNHFGKKTKFLEVAKRTKEFVFKYARQHDGWWAEELSREGKVLCARDAPIQPLCLMRRKAVNHQRRHQPALRLGVNSGIRLDGFLLKRSHEYFSVRDNRRIELGEKPQAVGR